MSKARRVPLSRAAEVFEVDPNSKTGLRWMVDRNGGAKAGDEAGCIHNRKGYAHVRLDGVKYPTHRIIYAMSTGHHIPEGLQIDHINNDRADNRIENLRLVNNMDNSRKQLPRKGGTSRFKGVYWNKHRSTFRAQIKVNGRTTYLGQFVDEEDAARAYDKAALKYFGVDNCVLNYT